MLDKGIWPSLNGGAGQSGVTDSRDYNLQDLRSGIGVCWVTAVSMPPSQRYILYAQLEQHLQQFRKLERPSLRGNRWPVDGTQVNMNGDVVTLSRRNRDSPGKCAGN
jgi:hypothetical protein